MNRAMHVQVQAIAVPQPFIVKIKLELILCFIFTAALAAKIWVQTEATQVGYELASARKYAIELDMQRRELELHKSFMLRPDRLRDAASTRLGLEDLNPKQAVKIKYVD